MLKFKGISELNSNYSFFVFLIFISLTASFQSFAQLNSAGNPPDEVLKALAIKHPGVEANNWSWDSKLVEYVGYFVQDGKTNEIHINTYGKWIKTITYLEKQHLPKEVIEGFEHNLNTEAIVSEVFLENSKDWGKQFKIRFINESEASTHQEHEYTFSENYNLVATRTYKKHHVPFVVAKKFDDTYKDASKEKWNFNAELFAFEVSFKLNKDKKTAYFAPDGEWMWLEKTTSKREVPDEVISTIETTKYKDWKMDDVVELISNQIKKCYKIKLKNHKEKQYLIFSTEGDLLTKSDLL